MARRWRVCLPGIAPDRGEIVELPSGEAHHVRRVLRLREGERIGLFDGDGHEWSARIMAGDGRQVEVRVEDELVDSVEPDLELALHQALCRPDRLEWVIQKGTEIGIAGFYLHGAERSERLALKANRLERLRRIAAESCKQCGRRRVPTVELEDEIPPGRGSGFILHRGPESSPLGDLLGPEPLSAASIAVGPEGGFTQPELDRWGQRGWRVADLGPRTLRAETAGLVAATLVLHHKADLGRSARFDSDPAGS